MVLGKEYCYEQYIEEIECLLKRYQTILKGNLMGHSYDNRDLILLQLGFGKKGILYTAGVHGRECINPVVFIKLIETYCEILTQLEYFNGYCTHDILSQYSFYFMPLVNPDGYAIALQGYSSIKNLHLRHYCESFEIPSEEWKYNARGIDLNRNFPSVTWKKKSQFDIPASEIETKVVIAAIRTLPIIAYLDFHSRGKKIYHYRKQMPDWYNKKQKEIAEAIRKKNYYSLVPPEEEIEPGDTGGNTVHFYSEFTFNPAFTIETVLEEATFPLQPFYQKETYQEINLILPELLKALIRK